MIADPKWMRFAAVMSSAVTVKGLLIFGGYWFGSWLDGKFGTYPWMMFLFIVVGTILGFFWILHVANRRRPKP